jgi:cell wall-associated NlpC family hydrolase
MLILLTACGAPPGYMKGGREISASDRQKLVAVAGSYIGSPYRFGGTNAKGFDCSGLVYRVYKQALHRNLPRTTQGQFNNSIKIDSDKAKPGDLVFFRIKGARIDHVGMMISNYQFIHSSKSNGVIISDFGNEYYRQHFSSIRRLR